MSDKAYQEFYQRLSNLLENFKDMTGKSSVNSTVQPEVEQSDTEETSEVSSQEQSEGMT